MGSHSLKTPLVSTGDAILVGIHDHHRVMVSAQLLSNLQTQQPRPHDHEWAALLLIRLRYDPYEDHGSDHYRDDGDQNDGRVDRIRDHPQAYADG